MKDSAYWMARVARMAKTLSEIRQLAAAGVVDQAEVENAQESYGYVIHMYTNPFNTSKGI